MNMTTLDRFYVVIQVWRGVITDVEAYTDLQAAFARQDTWKKEMNPMDDDFVVYETKLHSRNTALS